MRSSALVAAASGALLAYVLIERVHLARIATLAALGYEEYWSATARGDFLTNLQIRSSYVTEAAVAALSRR